MHSDKQLWTIKTFGTAYMCNTEKELRDCNYNLDNININNKILHGGVAGCGKTYSIEEGFGLYCSRLQNLGIEGLNFVLMGQSRKMVELNQCSILADLYGKNFSFDSGHGDNKTKDGKLFSQNLIFVGLSDSKSEERIRGLSNIVGIIHDEATLSKEEQLALIFARLRGQLKPDVKEKFRKNMLLSHFYVGSTNPDGPQHFLLSKYIKKNLMKYLAWYMGDASYDGAKQYYKQLLEDYANCPSLLQRFLYGLWVGSDFLVYPNFRLDKNMGTWDDDWYTKVKRTVIGIDAGSNHATCFVVANLSYEGQYIVSVTKKLRHTAPSEISLELGKLYRSLCDKGANIAEIYIDPAALWLKEQLMKDGFKPKGARNSHSEGIGCIRTLISRGDLIIDKHCVDLKDEMLSYSFKSKDSEDVKKEGDDAVDAMRYAIYSDYYYNNEGGSK